LGFTSCLYFFFRWFGNWFAIFFPMTGPGGIVTIVDNDAGGMTTHTVTGAE